MPRRWVRVRYTKDSSGMGNYEIMRFGVGVMALVFWV